jgi:uncharacterized delta-60 repeat protein
MTKKLFILMILVLVSIPTFAQSVHGESVDTAWVRTYDGPGSSYDYAFAMTVDGSGNVYVTGSSGVQQYSNCATIKYYPNGDTAWLRIYNGLANDQDVAYAIAVSSSGNVYVSGSSYGIGTGMDFVTIKYHPNGDTAWVRRYNGPGDSTDWVYAMAIDYLGNVYVTGESYSWETDEDYATIKYYSNGDTAWVRRYNGPGNYIDEPYAIAVDDSGNVYVTGHSVGGNQPWEGDYATIKYHSNGDTAWVRRYNGPGNYDDWANAIAVDGSGNVYVTGQSVGVGTLNDYTTIKYNPNGDALWLRRYHNYYDEAEALAVDLSGNVYVTGVSSNSETWEDYVTIKYYPNGDTAWVERYNGPGTNSTDDAFAIAVDDSGNVYVTGISGSPLHYDYATIRYYPNGDTAWVRRYNGAGDYYDWPSDIAVDDSGNVYVTGYSYGWGTSLDYTTIKYVQFLCGDVNKDGAVNSADVSYLINYLFISGPAPIPILHVGDVNVDEVVNSADVAYLISYLFIGGLPPCQQDLE